MDAPSAARVKAWLLANRGDETQQQLADDITKVTGWHITRDRYSKYEGKLPIGKKVLAHFVDYWATRGRPGPFDAPEPTTGTETPDPLVSALQAQTLALTALVDELRLWRTEDRARLAQVEAMVDGLVSGTLGAPGTPASTEPPVPDGIGQ